MFVPGPEEAVADYLVRGLRPAERLELAGYLDGLLVQPDANERLLELWNQSQADFYMLPNSRLDLFFAMIRERL